MSFWKNAHTSSTTALCAVSYPKGTIELLRQTDAHPIVVHLKPDLGKISNDGIGVQRLARCGRDNGQGEATGGPGRF